MADAPVHDFVVGDIVRLKSGSPWMTVSTIYKRYMWLSWFAGPHHHQLNVSPEEIVRAPADVDVYAAYLATPAVEADDDGTL